MSEPGAYKIVQLRSGVHSIHSLEHGETMHPGVGPVAEAQALYVDQLRLPEQVQRERDEFVIWDVGLGGAANALTVLRALGGVRARVRLVSFDHTIEPLRFAFQHRDLLGYFAGFERAVSDLLARGEAAWKNADCSAVWVARITDFPALLQTGQAPRLPKPHLILFDPWSPAKNPAMWTASLFSNLFDLLDPARPCVMPTYSRSTLLRVTLLLAGFWVGCGRAAGNKEETTLASNFPERIDRLLDARWLERVRQSDSAEPLWMPVYRQARLMPETRLRLELHPQFRRPGQPI